MPKRNGSVQKAVDAKRPCANSALDFDNLPYVQSAVSESQVDEYPCFTPLPSDEETNIEFRIDKTDYFTDLSNSMLFAKLQIMNKDGSDVEPTDFCTYVNNIGYAIFDSVELYISDQKVTHSETFYAWWTYVYNLTYYSTQAAKTYLEPGNCWFLDTPGLMESYNLAELPKNKGFQSRHSRCGESKPLWIATRIMLNTPLNKLIPPQTEVTLRFHRAPTSSCLLSDSGKEYKIRIHEAKLQASKAKLFEDAQRHYDKILASKGFYYSFATPLVRTKTVSAGDQNVDWIPFTGKLPQRIYFWQISQKAYNGDLAKNQYNFQPYGINKLQIFKNGRSVPSGQGLVNLQATRYLGAFLTTAEAINSPETFKIPFDSYANGYFLIAVDISPDFSAGCDYDNFDESGSVRMVIDYTNPLEEPITLFCLGEVQQTLQIDSNRHPHYI